MYGQAICISILCVLLFLYVVPSAPTLLNVVASAPRNLTMIWEEPSTPNGKIIRYTVAVNNRALLIENITGMEFVLSGLLPYTDYTVSAQACTREGCGSFSNEITNKTLQEGG